MTDHSRPATRGLRFIVVRDITPPRWSTPFPRHRSFIDYDAKRPIEKKQHQLIYQQGDHYGLVGDMCSNLTHEELLALERDGFVRRVRG